MNLYFYPPLVYIMYFLENKHRRPYSPQKRVDILVYKPHQLLFFDWIGLKCILKIMEILMILGNMCFFSCQNVYRNQITGKK